MNITLHLKIWGPTVTAEADVYTALKYHVVVDENGTRRYYNVAGRLHRLDGPAVEYASGSKAWYQNGKRHREDGPAGEYAGGKEWFQNGVLHREDGPAIEYANGYQEWWLNGNTYIESEYYAKLKALGQTP